MYISVKTVRNKIFLLLLLFSINNICLAQIGLHQQMDSLAQSVDLEYVSFEKLAEINLHGSYGSTYIYNFLPNFA